eukprot:15482987-Alexandrium_andersonii.AAC.1
MARASPPAAARSPSARRSRRSTFTKVGGIYVLEMLIAPPRVGRAGGAGGVAGKPPQQPEPSDVPR